MSIESIFSPHSQAKEFQIRFQLTNLSKGDQTIADYFGKVRYLVDSLATTGNILSDKKIVTYLLNELGSSFEFFITLVTTRPKPLSFHENFQLVLTNESRMAHQNRSIISSLELSVNYSASGARDQRGRGSSRGRQGRDRGKYSPNSNCGGGGHSNGRINS